MVTAYDFEDDDQKIGLAEIGKKLSSPGKAKDNLIKMLKQAGEVLEKTLQTDVSAKDASKGIAKAVVQKSILDHKDKDVRVCAAYCLSHILKIHAPESPYTTAQLQDIFGLFLWVFRRLEHPSAPSYQLTLSVLDNISQIKCCLLMLDFDNNDMVCDLFQVMLDTINDANHESVEPAMLEIMASMIEEADDVSQQLLDTILECLTPPKMDDQPQSYRLAQQLLHRAEDRLQRYLQRFLNSIITGKAEDSSLPEDDYATLIHEVYQACPQTLLPVLPLLAHELQLEDEGHRLAAIDLLGKLFAFPDSDMDQEHGYLFEEFLRRCKDQKTEVRLSVIHQCSRMLHTCPHSAAVKVLEAIEERLQDFEDKVRSRAISAICEAAATQPQTVTMQAMEAVSQRLRDKKLSVRREAATQLAAVFRAYCSQPHEEDMAADEEKAIWIPGRLLMAATRDQELYSFILDSLMRNGLFPAKLGAKTPAQLWGAVFMGCSEQERSAILAVLKAKSKQQQDMQSFLAVRADKSPSGSPFASGHDARVAQAMRQITAAFPDSAHAESAMQKIHEMPDGHIFKGLATLCAPGTTLETALKVAKDTVQRIGSKGAVGEFARCLCTRLSPNLIAPEHLKGLLEEAQQRTGKAQDSNCQSAVLNLLIGCAASAPNLFATLGTQVAALLASKDAQAAIAAATVLTHAAAPMLQSAMNEEEEHEDLATQLKPLLLQLVSCGTPKAAKVAIRALNRVLSTEEAKATFQTLAKKLIALLQKSSAISSPALPAALKALGALGPTAPAVFAQHADGMADFVLNDLLDAPIDTLSPGKAKHLRASGEGKAGTSPHQGIVLKMLGLKALAAACVCTGSDQPANTKQATARLMDQLVSLVDPECDLDHIGATNPADEGCVRLAAAKALLKLARSQDNPVSADVYLQLALTMQDPIMEVRHQFAAKVHHMIQGFQRDPSKGHKAAKWAAVFPLAAMDPTQANCQAAFSFLMEFVAVRRRAVQHRVSVAAANQSSGGTMLHEYPDFLLPFIIQSLAHHPDFPTQEDLEKNAPSVLEPFQKMLQFALEPLLLYVDPVADQPGLSLPVIQKILRTLKHTEDATSQDATTNIYILCDIALAMADALAKKSEKQKPVKGKGSAAAAVSHPGSVPLPSSFYKSVDLQSAGRRADGSHLPSGFKLQVTDFLPKQLLLAGKSSLPGPKGTAKGRTEKAGEGKGQKAKGKAAGVGRKRPSDECRDGGSKKKKRKQESEDEQSESDDDDVDMSEEEPDMAEHDSPEAQTAFVSPAKSSGQKKKAAVTASAASPQSGSKGQKQTGRRHQRDESEQSDDESGKEEEVQPSPKRANKGRIKKAASTVTSSDAEAADASPSKPAAKQKPRTGQMTKAIKGQMQRAAKGQASAAKGKSKAGQKGKQVITDDDRGDDSSSSDEGAAEIEGPGRKGNQALDGQKGKADGQQRKTDGQKQKVNGQQQKADGQKRKGDGQKRKADGQQQRVAKAVVKKAKPQSPAKRNKPAVSRQSGDRQTGSVSSPSVTRSGKGKQEPVRRGRRGVSDEEVDRHDADSPSENDAVFADLHSPGSSSEKKPKGVLTSKQQNAGSKAKVAAMGGKTLQGKKKKAEQPAKAKQDAQRQQPRRGAKEQAQQKPTFSGKSSIAASPDSNSNGASLSTGKRQRTHR